MSLSGLSHVVVWKASKFLYSS